MIWRILKGVLKYVDVTVQVVGDIAHIRIVLGGNTVLDRKVDFIPGA